MVSISTVLFLTKASKVFFTTSAMKPKKLLILKDIVSPSICLGWGAWGDLVTTGRRVENRGNGGKSEFDLMFGVGSGFALDDLPGGQVVNVF